MDYPDTALLQLSELDLLHHQNLDLPLPFACPSAIYGWSL